MRHVVMRQLRAASALSAKAEHKERTIFENYPRPRVRRNVIRCHRRLAMVPDGEASVRACDADDESDI